MNAKKPTSENNTTAKSGTSEKAVVNKPKKADKQSKIAKRKIVRDSFPFPALEYEQLSALKATFIAAGVPVKRGELLRAGLALLNSLEFSEIKSLVEQVDKIHHGRGNTTKH